MPCLEAEILQATVDKDTFPIYLLAEAGELKSNRQCTAKSALRSVVCYIFVLEVISGI